MELLWEKLVSDCPGNPEGHGDLYFSYFLFELNGRLLAVHRRAWGNPENQTRQTYVIFDDFDIVSGERLRTIFTPPNAGGITSPANWRFHISNGSLCLRLYPDRRSLPESALLSEQSYMTLYYSNGKITSENAFGIVPPKEYYRTYTFGDYQLNEKGYCTVCRNVRTSEVVWKKRHGVSYLYTPIEEKNGIIYFGTAGNGGHFYAIELETGEMVCDISNGSAAYYVWYGDKVCIKDKKGNLIMFDPLLKDEPQILELTNFKLDNGSPIVIYKDYLFALADKKAKSGAWDRFFAFCVKL